MRQRALEHVAFLMGQGVGKGKAHERVGAAIKVNTETIRTWERTERDQMLPDFNLERAERAGELSIKLADDPDFVKIGSGDSLDGYVYEKYLSLKKEPLPEFGRRFVQNYGVRYTAGYS